MKGLILLFLAIALFGICWGYLDSDVRSHVRRVVVKNILPIILAVLAVSVAVFLSVNTTLRLV